METISIVYPGKNATIPVGLPFVASVIMSKRLSLRGRILETGATGRPDRRGQRRLASGRYQWVMRFDAITETGYYTLRVDPKHADDALPQVLVFEVKGGYPDLTIASHTDDQNITDQRLAFVAFGALGTDSIDSVKMIPTAGAAIPADFVNEDWENDTWTAMFPEIPLLAGGNTYTLKVLDKGTVSKQKQRLICQ
jgi:hypothetical protein